MCKRLLFLILLLPALFIAVSAWPQDGTDKPSPAKKSGVSGKAAASKPSTRPKTTKAPTTTQKKGTSPKTATASKRAAPAKNAHQTAAQQRAHAARMRRMTRAFVASATLKPMARQLIEARTPTAYAGVEKYARQHVGTDAGGMAWLTIGYAYILDREYAKAVAPLEKARPYAGELVDYVRYFEALAYGGSGQSNKVVATLKGFSKECADSIFLNDARAVYGEALVASGQASEAISFLEANRAPTRADAELALGHAYLHSGNPVKGMEILRHLYLTMPLSTEAAQAGAELIARGSSLTGSYGDLKMHASLLAKGNRWADAAREYRQLLNMAPPVERGEIEVGLGDALRHSGKGGEREGRDLLQRAQVTGESNAQRLYELAEIARTEGNESDLLNYLSQFRQSAPASAWFQSALISAGNMYMLKKDYDHAIDYYREAQERFPEGSRASYAHWKAAWLTYRQGRTEEAKKEFTQHVRIYPASLETAAAVYWRGRIAEDQNDLPLARAWYAKVAERYRNYYYGHLAAERLAKIGVSPTARDPILDMIAPLAPLSAASALTSAPVDALRVEKSKLLENVGMTDFAVKELQASDGGRGPNWATLEIARIYSDGGQYHRALRFMKSAVPSYFAIDISLLPRPYWDYLFPRPYWTEVRRFAMENQLDPYLVAALIRQESEFNPGAVSGANAFGLMQLLPITGKKTANELRIRGFRTETLLVPNINLQLGTRYFRDMVEHYNGQVEYALAAYNAGPHRVEDWLSVGNYRDVPEFVESIPFTETREYVQSIMRNARIYRRLYPQ
jgi:soluble lytic murein transglycosylase